MARMIPDLDADALAAVPSAAERDVYRRFRDQLPPHVWVLHGLNLMSTTRAGALRDLEADFVVFDRDSGLLLVEVKGGGVSFDPRTDEWHSIDRRGTRHGIKDPFSQARRAMYAVLRTLRSEGKWPSGRAPRIVAAYGALFPDLMDVRSLVRPGIDVRQAGGARELDELAAWTAGLFAAFRGRESDASALGPAGMQAVERLFCRPVVVQAPLALAIDKEARRQIELTERQAVVLRSLSRQTRALVAGGAGTGKTLLAVKQARSFAAAGLRTLLVCFNRPLAAFLERQTSGTPNLRALTFHKLAGEWVNRARTEHDWDPLADAQEEDPDGDEFETHLPMALALATEAIDDRYDAIVVDEGQDLPPDAWFALQLLLREDDEARLFIFFDPNQAVYGVRSSLPMERQPYLLVENCRNTRPIHEASYRYYEGEEVDPPDIDGADIEWIEAPTPVHQARAIRKLVSSLVQNERLRPEDVVVLTTGRGNRPRWQALRAAGEPSGARWSDGELWRPGRVVFDAASRFKGLEASVVVLWVHDTVDPVQDGPELYVGLSRARSRIWIVGAERSLRRLRRADTSCGT